MKTIVFKIQEFPHLSETFVIAQIVTAINAGLTVNVLVKRKLDIDFSSHRKLIDRYQIEEKIILEEYKVPSQKIIKILKAGILFLKNLQDLSKVIKYYSKKSRFSLTWIFEFDFYQKFRRTDIIHVQYGTNTHPVDLLKASGVLKGRLIVSFHGHDAFFPINGYIPNNDYYKYLFSKDNLIVANTPYLAKKIEGLGCRRENLRVIPVGVDTNFFRPIVSNTKKRNIIKFITVGRLDRIKGHRFAVELMRQLKGQGYNVQLTIIGDGAERANLIQQVDSLNIKQSVFLIGKKSQGEILFHLRQSDIYILTAVALDDGRRETQGLATLEAEATGLPVLAFDSGGIKYTIKNGVTGFLCEEKDIRCLVGKSKLLMEAKIRKEMGKNAISFVQENFDQKIIDKKWQQLYGREGT